MNTLARRIVGSIPVIVGISFLIFLLMHIAPGDPVTLLLGDDATPADVERTRHEWGLDKPLLVQYWDFLSRAITGDFGRSLKFNESVMKLIGERLPATLELAFVSLCIAIMIAVPLGVYSAIKHNSFLDHAGMSVALIGVSLPNFWLGIMLIYFLGGQLNLLPVAGRIDYGTLFTRQFGYRKFPRFLERVAASIDAGVHLGIGARGHRYTHLAIERARSHAPGLHHNSTGERLGRKNRDLATYIAKCPDYHRDHTGASVGRVAERFGHHRDGIFLSWNRRSVNPIHFGARLQAHPSVDSDVRRHLFRREFVGRFALQL